MEEVLLNSLAIFGGACGSYVLLEPLIQRVSNLMGIDPPIQLDDESDSEQVIALKTQMLRFQTTLKELKSEVKKLREEKKEKSCDGGCKRKAPTDNIVLSDDDNDSTVTKKRKNLITASALQNVKLKKKVSSNDSKPASRRITAAALQGVQLKKAKTKPRDKPATSLITAAALQGVQLKKNVAKTPRSTSETAVGKITASAIKKVQLKRVATKEKKKKKGRKENQNANKWFADELHEKFRNTLRSPGPLTPGFTP